MHRTAGAALALAALLAVPGAFGSQTRLLRPADVVKMPASPADRRISYGSDPLQFGELRLPKTKAPHPVAIVIHGGCWESHFADLQIMAPLSTALTSMGLATWNLEYRRIDNSGGGWPGTFQDIAHGIDHLRSIARTYSLDLNRVIVIGHSAGGHLALWAAARHRLRPDSVLYSPKALRVKAVVSLAGPADLRSFRSRERQVCGDGVVTRLIGGSPDEVPERYRQGAPVELLPLGVEQILITGAQDRAVPPEFDRGYEIAARSAGDKVRRILLEGAGHFEVIAPGSSAWSEVEAAVLSLFKKR